MSRLALFACWPYSGHLLPQMAIAGALRARGEEVAFLTGTAALPTLQDAGMPATAFRAVDERAAAAAVGELERVAGAGRPSVGDVRRCFDRWLLDTIPGQVQDLSDAIARRRPDVIVSDVALWAPMVITAEVTGIQVALATIFMGPPARGPGVPPPGLGLPAPTSARTRALSWSVARATDVLAGRMRRRVDDLRAGHGLPPMGCSINAFMARAPLTIVPSLRELDYGRPASPPGVYYVGQCRWQRRARPEAARALDELPADRPSVHVVSTAMEGAEPFLLRAAARGLGGRPLHVVASTGGAATPEDLCPSRLPANVHVTEWVDHNHLLPHCAAVVTAGGTGSIVAALAAGVPLVVVPTAWDKPDNARRVEHAGVGVRLPARDCTPDRLRRAVRTVLDDPRYQANARRMARLLAAAPGPTGAADLVAGLGAEPAPGIVPVQTIQGGVA